ncbi:MAG: DUF4328 domain-containing protein [Pseudomonadota bacterium]
MNADGAQGFIGADFDRLLSRASFAKTTILIAIAFFAMVMVGEFGELFGFIDVNSAELDTTVMIYAFVLIGFGVGFLISAIGVCMWIYRAHATLRETGREDLEYSPGWAVGWFFIPFANLWMPYQAMRALWNESHLTDEGYGSEPPSGLGQWWACWIGSNILSNFTSPLTEASDGSIVQIGFVLAIIANALSIGSALLLYRIIESITQAQITNLGAMQAFE